MKRYWQAGELLETYQIGVSQDVSELTGISTKDAGDVEVWKQGKQVFIVAYPFKAMRHELGLFSGAGEPECSLILTSYEFERWFGKSNIPEHILAKAIKRAVLRNVAEGLWQG